MHQMSLIGLGSNKIQLAILLSKVGCYLSNYMNTYFTICSFFFLFNVTALILIKCNLFGEFL